MSEIQDNVKSTQIAEVVDIISEGDCVGLVNGPKDVFLDGTPLQNSDGSFNFERVYLDWRPGTLTQSPLPGINAVQSENTVNVTVLKASPVVRTITSSSVDKCRVTLIAPRLSYQDTSTGDISGSSFEFAIDVKPSGGLYSEVVRRTISGKTNSQYSKSFEFALVGNAPWDIRVRRITDDPPGANVANAFQWASFTEIQSVRLRYPYTGYTFLRFDAQSFNQIPPRTFRWRGKKIKVPTNYNTTTRVYSGTWDGTFKTEWSDNPAWVFYDMVTTERYGLGGYINAAEANKWRLYKIAQYCDGLVPNGRGGTEPRFTINVQIRERKEAMRLLQDLTAVFRGMPFWDGAKVDVYQDAPEPVSLVYAPANVKGGNFEYEGGTSEKSRHSVFICYWNDMTDQGRRTAEVYAPGDLIARYGMREVELTPMGVTSRGMAARLCRWARHTEQSEGDSVSFEVGSDGIVAQPGKVFAIADPTVSGERLGGRIVSATSSQVTIDSPVTLDAGVTYSLTVMQPDPADHMGYATEERSVTTSAGSGVTVLNVSPAFSSAPTAGTLWILASSNIEPTTWRCTDVEEIEGGGYRVSGTAYNASKFDAIELGLTLDEPIISKLSATASPPTGLTLSEEVYSNGTVNKAALTIAFVPASGSSRYQIKYRRDTEWWVDLPETTEQSATIRDLDPGVYDVVVRAINGLGNVSPAVQATITLAGGKSGVRVVRLKASSLTFKVPTSGPASPSSITLSADCGALDEASLSWSVTGGTLTGTGVTRTLTYANMTADTAQVTATITEGGAVYTDSVTIIKVYDGAPGTPGATGPAGSTGATGATGPAGAPAPSAVMTLDSIGLPADSSGAITSYAGATSTMLVTLGGANDTANWTFSHIATDVTVTRSVNTITVTAMGSGVAIGYVDVTATRSGYPSLTKRVTVSKYKTGATGSTGATGAAGPRGSVTLAAATTGTTWSDSEANAAITGAGFAGPVNRDVVTLYNASSGWSQARFYSGTSWLTLNAWITGNLLVDGTVSADKIDSRGLSIKDNSGNVILQAGSGIDWTKIGGANANMKAGAGANLLADSAISDLAGWTSYTQSGVGLSLVSQTRCINQSGAPLGYGSVLTNWTGPTTSTFDSSVNTVPAKIRVSPGQRVELQAYIQVFRGAAQLEASFLNSSGSYIGSSIVSGGVSSVADSPYWNQALSDFTRLWGFATVPANAAYVYLEVRMKRTSTAGNTDLYLALPYIGFCGNVQTDPTPWNAGPPKITRGNATTYIADTAIGTAQIDSLAVTTAKIADLAVENAKLANLAVTNAKMANAAVDTLKIAGESVIVAAAAESNSYEVVVNFSVAHEDQGRYVFLGSFTQGSYKGGHVWYLQVSVNGGAWVNLQVEMPIEGTTGSLLRKYNFPAGNHSARVWCYTWSGAANCGLVAMGCKR